MSFSRTAPKRTSNALDLIAALRDAGEASALAQATDLGSIEDALSRLERATSLLRETHPGNDDHPSVRAEIDRAGRAARRLFEQMIEERDRLGAELAAATRARTLARPTPHPSLDLTL